MPRLRQRTFLVFLALACVGLIHFVFLDRSFTLNASGQKVVLHDVHAQNKKPEVDADTEILHKVPPPTSGDSPDEDGRVNKLQEVKDRKGSKVQSTPTKGVVLEPQSSLATSVKGFPPTKIADSKLDLTSNTVDQSSALAAQFPSPSESLSHARPAHWIKPTPKYPIPTENLHLLPTGKPQYIPRIQKAFPEEDAAQKTERLKRQAAVKEEFLHAWNGYKEKALGHDELKPVSGSVNDPFGQWAATMVDALDTLWIMGLKEEFDLVVKYVEKIDFTTTNTDEIRIFETVIRYLGSLIGSYDISGGEYSILLKKAEELAAVLMGAFDTPNHMPILYYKWKPEDVNNNGRASVDSTTSEIGSLSLEFIRLAQLTGKNEYYDAVQRVTDALEAYQNSTLFPGLWPTRLDASGCKSAAAFSGSSKSDSVGGSSGDGYLQEDSKDTVIKIDDSALRSERRHQAFQFVNIFKRKRWTGTPSSKLEPCLEQGLADMPFWGSQRFTVGSQVDSLYEYLIKDYLLLGGLHKQYERMYLRSIDMMRKYLFFKPFTNDSTDILLSGDIEVHREGEYGVPTFLPEMQHLTCFVGGMVGLASKALNLKDDIDLAIKLTNGCVWAYNSTTTGIMPEIFTAEFCRDDNCRLEKVSLQNVENGPRTRKKGKRAAILNPSRTIRQKTRSPNRTPGLKYVNDARYILRPEAIESVFYMYRITADSSWQEKGWRMFVATINATKTKFGHSAIFDVNSSLDHIYPLDSMESFWLAETLKYYYLLFSEPSVVSLDEYVFNTEAHPFLRPRHQS